MLPECNQGADQGGVFRLSTSTPSIFHCCLTGVFQYSVSAQKSNTQWYDPNQDPKSSSKEHTFKEKRKKKLFLMLFVKCFEF